MSGGNNGKVLTVSRKLAKILTDSRKSHHPVEILYESIEHRAELKLLRHLTNCTDLFRDFFLAFFLFIESEILDEPASGNRRTKQRCVKMPSAIIYVFVT